MKDDYKNLAKSYDDQLKDKATRKMYLEWKNYLMKAIKQNKIKVNSLIDLGCGTGITTIPWIKKGYSVTGIEVSKPMLKEARKKSSKVRWINQDLVNLKIKEKFEVATCHFDVLNHILKKSDLQKAFNNICSVLNNNGIFIFDVMSPESFNWLEKRGRNLEISERPYSKNELKIMIDKTDFRLLGIRKQKTPEWDGKPRRLIFLCQKI